MKIGFSRQILEKYYLMNICQAGTELFYKVRGTDGQTDMTALMVYFRKFAT